MIQLDLKTKFGLFAYPAANKANPEIQAQRLGEDLTVVSTTAWQWGQVKWAGSGPTGTIVVTIDIGWSFGLNVCTYIWAA